MVNFEAVSADVWIESASVNSFGVAVGQRFLPSRGDHDDMHS